MRYTEKNRVFNRRGFSGRINLVSVGDNRHCKVPRDKRIASAGAGKWIGGTRRNTPETRCFAMPRCAVGVNGQAFPIQTSEAWILRQDFIKDGIGQNTVKGIPVTGKLIDIFKGQ